MNKEKQCSACGKVMSEEAKKTIHKVILQATEMVAQARKDIGLEENILATAAEMSVRSMQELEMEYPNDCALAAVVSLQSLTVKALGLSKRCLLAYLESSYAALKKLQEISLIEDIMDALGLPIPPIHTAVEATLVKGSKPSTGIKDLNLFEQNGDKVNLKDLDKEVKS